MNDDQKRIWVHYTDTFDGVMTDVEHTLEGHLTRIGLSDAFEEYVKVPARKSRRPLPLPPSSNGYDFDPVRPIFIELAIIVICGMVAISAVLIIQSRF